MCDSRSIKPAVAFVAVLAALSVLVFVDLPDTLASPPRQDVCPCAPPYWMGIPCCTAGTISSTGKAKCTAYCTGYVPGGPTTTPEIVVTLPPATWQARATEIAATSDARGTMVIEATQTKAAGIEGVECFSCYETDRCPSGWGSICFYRYQGHLYPSQILCQPAEECEPTGGPTEPECIPGRAFTEGFVSDPCEGWEWTWDLRVQAIVPPHIVQVRPFPRWLVGMGAPLPAPYESGEAGTLTLQDYPALTNFLGACQPNADSEGCWSQKHNKPDPIRTDPETGEEAPLPGDIKDFRVGLRWRRIDVMSGDDDPSGAPATCWDWDEREWNIGQDYGYGPVPAVTCGKSVSHIYETSSWGKPKNGPNFIPPEDACTTWTPACDSPSLPPGEEARCHCCEQVPASLEDWASLPSFYDFDPDLGAWQNPAYQVKVPTYWALEWAAEWYQWEKVSGCAEDSCGCKVCEAPGGCSDRCDCRSGEGEGYCSGENEFCDCDDKYDWVHHNFTDKRWNLIDLRNYGKGTWYHTSWSVRTTGSYAGCAFEYGDPNPGTSVRIPVIEVQSVLRDPCYLDGTCPE